MKPKSSKRLSLPKLYEQRMTKLFNVSKAALKAKGLPELKVSTRRPSEGTKREDS